MRIYISLIFLIIFYTPLCVGQPSTETIEKHIEQLSDAIENDSTEQVAALIEVLNHAPLTALQQAQVDYYQGTWNDLQYDFSKASQFLDASIAALDSLYTIKPDKEVGTYYVLASNRLLYLLYRQGRALPRRNLNRRAYALAKQQNLERELLATLRIGAILDYVDGDLDGANESFKELAQNAETQGDSSMWNTALGNRATVLRGLGRLPESVNLFQQSLALAQYRGNTTMIMNAYTGLGQVYYSLHDDDSAKIYFRRKLAVADSAGNEYDFAFGASDYADIFKRNQQWDSAQHWYNISLRMRRDLDDQAGVAYVLERVGDMYMVQGDLETALLYADSGLAVVGNEAWAEEKVLLLSGKAKILVSMGRSSQALAPALESLQWADSTGRLDHQKDATQAIYLAYEGLNQKAKAFDYLKRYHAILDSLGGESNTREIARLEYQYRAEQDRKLAEAEAEKERSLYEARLQLRNWILGGVCIIIILLAWLALSARRYGKQHKKDSQRLSRLVGQLKAQNQELETLRQQEKERSEETFAIKDSALAAMAMSSHEKDAILEQITLRVQRLESHMDSDHQSEIRSIYKDLNDTVNRNESWDTFLHRFEAVHPLFFERLKKDYPVLTNNDLKISAYIKVGMTNKDIAQVTNLAVASVKKNLNRLKKKLNLSAEDSIRDFMLEY